MSRHTRPFKHTYRIPIHGGGKKDGKKGSDWSGDANLI